MSRYWDAVDKIAAELRTKPISAASYAVIELDKKRQDPTVTEDDRHAHGIVSIAAKRVMEEYLAAELLPNSTVLDRITHIRQAPEDFHGDPIAHLAYNVIERSLDKMFPGVSDAAFDAFIEQNPDIETATGWGTYLADAYVKAYAAKIAETV